MKIAIMQPYFLPYIGYFQLIAAADVFVIYDNIKYTKKGWINRNRLLLNNSDVVFSLPLAKGADTLNVDQRKLAVSFVRDKLVAQFQGAYSRAPEYSNIFPMLQDVIRNKEDGLFQYIQASVVRICQELNISTKIVVSSEVAIDHSLKGQDKVIALCRSLGGADYINAVGGQSLYDAETFAEYGLSLKFIKSRPIEYRQFGATFVPWLSIVDVLMFNPLNVVREWVASNYEFI